MNELATLPRRPDMLRAFQQRDAAFDGIFVTAVRTTGIFCRPTCPARKPRPENVEFFASPRAALLAGFRPCLRCRPLEARGTVPEWLRPLLEELERDPSRRWKDQDLRERGLSPGRVRRWFQAQHGMTFLAYGRARRLGAALGGLQTGDDVMGAGLAHGFESASAFQDAFRRVLGSSPGAGRHATRVLVTRLPTPLGPLLAGATDEALCLLEFVDRRMLETQLARLQTRLGALFAPGNNAVLTATAAQLGEYFAGRRRHFDLPLVLPGTDFQREVWERLQTIPHGTTTSYGALARELGRPGAVRAVARANGDNRIAILVPCHRVVGHDGRLTGYAGGLWRKRRLLALERGELG